MPRFLTAALAALFLVGGSAGAFAANVEVAFSDKLTRNMDKINSIEKEREINFRKFLDDQPSTLTRTDRRFDHVKFAEVAWAGETLIPNIDDYTVENFVKALVQENLKRAGFDNVEGTIQIKIDRIKVANYSLAFMSNSQGFDSRAFDIDSVGDLHFSGVVSRDGSTSPTSNKDTYVKGRAELLDSSGNVVKSVKVTANMVYEQTVDNAYKGPGFAFTVTDPSVRVGPALTRFIQKSLDELFDTDAFYGVVVVGP